MLTTLLIEHPNYVNAESGVIAMVQGEAYQPFVRRALVPSLIRGLVLLTPSSVEHQINRIGNDLIDSGPAQSGVVGEKVNNLQDRWVIVGYALILNTLFFASFLYMLRSGLRYFYRLDSLWATLLPLAAVAIIPVFFSYPNYIYDFAQLFLFSTGIILIRQGKSRIYYFLLAAAAVNKETAMLLPFCFVAMKWKTISNKELILHFAGQLAIGAAAYLFLAFLYRQNQGTVQLWAFPRNLRILADLASYFSFKKLNPPFLPIAFWYPVGLNFFVWGTMVFLVGYRWRRKDSQLKGSLIIAVPLGISALLFGFVDEVRVFYEMIPIFFWLAAGSLMPDR